MKPLSSRAIGLQPSLTVAIDTKAKQMQSEGKDVVSLGAGEPDFNTPAAICAAGIDAIKNGKTRYTAPAGLMELRVAVCAKLLRENALSYKPEEVIITSGAKQAISQTLAALIEPGDEVIIPSPYWVTYPELVKFFGGIPIIVPTTAEQQFTMSAKQFKAALSSKTKLVILNTPSNPTGAVYTRTQLEEFAQIIIQNDLYCLTDEIYEHIVYEPAQHVSIASLGSEIKQRCIVINGVSKSYAMTGWRIGYLAANHHIAQAIAKVQGQVSHHPSNISQYAAIEALNSPNTWFEQLRTTFSRRRALVLQALNTIAGIEPFAPQGAFYAFAKVSSFYKKQYEGNLISGSIDLCTMLLESQGLAVVPGIAFGNDDYIRMSFAAQDSTLQEAMKRLQKGLAQLI
jgi:aspartate aminotransferase